MSDDGYKPKTVLLAEGSDAELVAEARALLEWHGVIIRTLSRRLMDARREAQAADKT